jgi:aspartate aminotransferase-like enzyme
VEPAILAAMGSYPLGHRTREFRALYRRLTTKLKTLLGCSGRVFVMTNSGTGAMEACIRNLVGRRVLNVACGAFGERWHAIARACGKPADLARVAWGRANRPDAVAHALAAGAYDTLTVVHNESSTGVMNPVAEIARQVRARHPDVLLCVDAVSSMAGAPMHFDDWGVDVLLASCQKAWGLPPGVAIVAVSERALARARATEGRGEYLDFVRYAESDDGSETPNTPSTAHFVALDLQCDRILAEGMDRRWERHRRMAETVRAWARRRWTLFAEPGFESQTLTCIQSPPGFDVAALLEALLRKHHVRVADGYGALKGTTWRLGHMGDVTEAAVAELLGWIHAEVGP